MALPSARRVDRPTPAQLRELMRLDSPFVASGLLRTWEPCSWGLDQLRLRFGTLTTCVRLHPRREPPVFEGECSYVQCSIQEFCDWLETPTCSPRDASISDPADKPFAAFPRADFVGYADYQDVRSLFHDKPEVIKVIDWAPILGDDARDGSMSVLWFGSEGANTPIHYDTYGTNVIAQCAGIKRWQLYPPVADAALRPSRIPYEESSVFAAGGADARGSSLGGEVQACETMLQAGELLFVPKHWWHRVTTESDWALSINSWLDAADDNDE